jgi:hypothetical protein
MKTIETKLIYTKSTKNKHVYGNAGVSAPIPSVYIERSALPADYPKSIIITVEVNDE